QEFLQGLAVGARGIVVVRVPRRHRNPAAAVRWHEYCSRRSTPVAPLSGVPFWHNTEGGSGRPRSRRADTGAMQRPLQTLYAYWNELRAGRLAPERLEIEPARICAILPETFMLEWPEPRTFLYRLAGTRLCELLGTELRGTNFFARFEERVRRDLQRRLGPAAGEGAGMLLLVEAGADPAQRLELEVLLLPL